MLSVHVNAFTYITHMLYQSYKENIQTVTLFRNFYNICHFNTNAVLKSNSRSAAAFFLRKNVGKNSIFLYLNLSTKYCCIVYFLNKAVQFLEHRSQIHDNFLNKNI